MVLSLPRVKNLPERKVNPIIRSDSVCIESKVGRMKVSMFSFFCLFILVSTEVTTSRGSKLSDFYKIRTNFPAKGCIWYYKGQIKSPMTGKEIAGIEGIEFLQNEKINFSSTLLNIRNFGYSSRKFFCYVNPANHSEPLLSFKIRTFSPKRSIPTPFKELNESINLQEIVYPSFNGNNGADSVMTPYYQSCLSFSSRPSLRTSFPFVSSPKPQPVFSKRFELFYSRPDLDHDQYDIAHLVTSNPSNDKTHFLLHQNHTAPVSSLRRFKLSNWISFASHSSSAGCHSQEKYTFIRKRFGTFRSAFSRLFPWESDGTSDVQMIYQRYGEGPSWYLPGKPVITEIQGYRFHELRNLPSSVLRLFSSQLTDLRERPHTLK
jgi:hypothetical protein